MIPLQGGANVPMKTERRGYDLSSFDNQLPTNIPRKTSLLTTYSFPSLLRTPSLLTPHPFPPYYLLLPSLLLKS